MKTLFGHRNLIVLIFGIMLLIYGVQGMSYAQEANPTITASTPQPLTEATLHGSVVTLTISGGSYEYSTFRIRNALTFSGIEGVTVGRSWDVARVSDTEVTVELTFAGDFDTDATLTIEVGAGAIPGYNGPALTAQLPVTAVEESLTASTEFPLTEVTLLGSVVTLTISGGSYERSTFRIRNALTFSGIEGVTVGRSWDVARVSDTEVTVVLTFNGDFDTDATLTIEVGAGALVGYNGPPLTAQLPVTAVEESLVASTEFPLTEANLDGNVITLSLSGRRFADRWSLEDGLTLSGIEGATIRKYSVERVSDTEATIELAFSGDFDTDATLTLTVRADAIAEYNEDFTFNFPVTAVEQSDATVSISPSPVALPAIGEKLTLNLNIANGENVAGYQATVRFNRSVLRYVESANEDYLPADAFFGDPIIDYGRWFYSVTIAGNTLAEASNGDGTLATLTFKGLDYKPSTVTLSEVYLVDADGKRWEVTTENGEILEPPELAERIFGDLNLDGVVNIQDLGIVSDRFGLKGRDIADVSGDGLVNIVDLVLVAGAFGGNAAAPSTHPETLEMFTASDVKRWLSQAQHLNLTDARSQRGVLFLEQLLTVLTPKEMALLANYPNPFNPETWIPYQLAKSTNVTIRIYAMNGTLVRTLALGHQPAGRYQSRSRAAYWDGKNAFGESVASGVYFYTLTTGDFTATRKMLIRK